MNNIENFLNTKLESKTFSYILVTISLITPIICSEIILRNFDNIFGFGGFFTLLIFFLSFLAPLILVLNLGFLLFDHQLDNRLRLKRIIISFLITIFAFTNVYYLIATWSDMGEARSKVIEIEYLNQLGRNNFLEFNLELNSDPSFIGIDKKLFSSIDYNEFGNKEYIQKNYFSKYDYLKGNEKEIVKPIFNHRSFVYASCLLYSIEQLTNMHASNIKSNSTTTHIITGIQKLFSIGYLVIIIGMLFSEWWDKK